MTDIYPRLVVTGADRALAFYTAAFGGTGDRAVHRPLRAGRARDGGRRRRPVRRQGRDEYDPAPTPGAVPVIIALYVDDPDAVAARMEAGGAQVVFPVADQEYGERGGRLADPFGHLWMLARRL
jgi:uncharacterized glyoxalase superfamily protein PhnB